MTSLASGGFLDARTSRLDGAKAIVPNPRSEIRDLKSPPLPCRLFIDPPADGAWNMAVDEALLEQAADDGLASLRFYQWSEPTLSLGYFQAYEDRASHPASARAAVVRRLSGGGALMHDRELTYSLCLPSRHPSSRQSAHLYGLAHATLIEVFAQAGVAAQLYETVSPRNPANNDAASASEPFLCFARRTDADIVALSGDREVKLVGSAQRRRRGAMLQHGAVLIGASPCAPELSGLQQLSSRRLDPAMLIPAWCEKLAERLNLVMISAGESAAAHSKTRQRLLAKYASPAWTMRR